MRLRFCLSLLVLCFWPCLEAADDNPCTPKPEPAPKYLSITGKILRISTGEAGEGIYITVDAKLPNCAQGPEQTAFFMPSSASQVRETLSIALLAFSQARLVEMHYPNCNPEPQCDTSKSGASIRLVSIAVRAQ